MKKLIPFTISPEVMGIVCGLMMFSTWPSLELMLLKAGWALLGIAMLAGTASFIVAARAGMVSPEMESRVRRGAWAGFFTVMVAAACLVFMTRMQLGGYAPIRAIMIAMASVMPAIMAGTIAAGYGAFLFRLDEPMIPASVPGAGDLPRPVRLMLRAGIATALLAALLSPLIPERPKAVAVTPVVMPRPITAAETVIPLPPPREPFKYAMPEALKTALPVSWSVRTQREIGAIQSDHGLALSRTGSLLAGLDTDGRIVVHDLESEEVRRISGIPYPVRDMAFSPDGERLFVVMQGQPLRVPSLPSWF